MSQTVDRALGIIEFFAEKPRKLGEVAAQAGIHKSTALRLLQTLEAQGHLPALVDGRTQEERLHYAVCRDQPGIGATAAYVAAQIAEGRRVPKNMLIADPDDYAGRAPGVLETAAHSDGLESLPELLVPEKRDRAWD